MKIIRNIKLLQDCISKYKIQGGDIGFVPTMGALHAGHLSLLQKSILENRCTICSIYVNPKQFNNQTDLLNYPRNELNDISKLKTLNCDILFLPKDDEIYTQNDVVEKYNFTDCFDKLEGQKRPGHFLGVVTIVHKLFKIIQPDKAYFGEKDYQQLWIMQVFQKKYNLSTMIKSCPTIRNELGLALSSRNEHLNKRQQKMAANLFKSLQKLKNDIELYNNGFKIKILPTIDLTNFKKNALDSILNNPLIKLDYFEIIDSENFSFANQIDYKRSYRILIAAYIGGIRLIDNISIN